MSGNWPQVWHVFAAAVVREPPAVAIGVWLGAALILVMAAEGLLVSLFPRHVFRRMRLLPPLPPDDPEDSKDEIRAPPDLRSDMRIEPTFPAPPSTPAMPGARRSAPVSDLRSRPVQTLKVIRNNSAEN